MFHKNIFLICLLFITSCSGNNVIDSSDQEYNSAVVKEEIIYAGEEFSKKEEPIEATTMEKNTFSIAFASAMDRKSVEENVVIFPDAEKTITWEDDKNMEIELKNIPDGSDEVLLNISSSSKTLSGVDLGKTITKNFLVEKDLEIDFISPEGAIIDLTKNITIRFNQPVVNLTSLDEQGNCPVTIDPQLEGKCVWITTSTVQFRPESGFPIGAKYSVVIPKGFEGVNGNILLSEKRIDITTPKFKVLNVDKELSNLEVFNIAFNAPVSIEEFKKHINIQKIDEKTGEVQKIENRDISINYFSQKDSLGKEVEKKNHLQFQLTSEPWGYDNKYIFSIKKGFTSIRGNVGLKVLVDYPRTVKSILSNYGEAIVRDLPDSKISINIIPLKGKGIITQNTPIIAFTFEEDVSKVSDIFEITSLGKKIKFEEYVPESYLEKIDLQANKYRETSRLSEGEKYSDRMKFIKINEKFGEDQKVTIAIKASKFSSSQDILLGISTSHKNSLVKMKFIDYKTTCLYFEKKLLNNGNLSEEQSKNFDFGGFGTLTNLSYIYKNHRICEYIEGNHGYVANTQLLPNSVFDMKIKSGLLDENYYPLDMLYTQGIKTGQVQNIDKQLSVTSSNTLNVIPQGIDNFGVLATSRHLDTLNVKVCNGKIDIVEGATDSMKNAECETKEISVANKGFELAYSVIDLQKVFGREFSKQGISVKISKLEKDIFIEKPGSYYYGEHSFEKKFIVHSTNAFIKSNQKKQTIWLYDFNTGKNIESSEVKKIRGFFQEYDYKKKLNKYKHVQQLKFSALTEGLIELDLEGVKNISYYMIELKSGEKILLKSPGISDISNKMAFVSTDKPIYKPGDVVNVKGYIRDLGADGFKKTFEKHIQASLKITDSQYGEIMKKDVKIGENGGFEYSFTLDKNAKLGNYRIEESGRNVGNFSVEEYEKPDFKVEVESNKKIYNYGETALVDITSKYYLGAPLIGGVGEVTFYEKPYSFDGGKTQGYLWGENKNYYWFDYNNNSYGNFQAIDSQKITLDPSGELKIDHLVKGEENKTYKVEAKIIDSKTKKSVSQSSEFIVLNSSVFSGINLDKTYYNFGEDIKINYVSVDKDGEKLPKKTLKFTFKKVKFETNKETGRSERKEEIILEKEVITDSSGVGEMIYNIEQYGELIIEVSADGNIFTTTKTLYIYGGSIVNVNTPSHKLNISPKKDSYKIGENAEFEIATSLVGKALITVEKQGKVFDYKLVDIDKTLSEHTFEVKEEYLPNFYVSATLIQQTGITDTKVKELAEIRTKQSVYEAKIKKLIDNDISLYNHFICTFSPFSYVTDKRIPESLLTNLSKLKTQEDTILQLLLPQYETGTVNVSVDKQTVVLDTKVGFDKTKYLPGEKQAITLEVNDSEGKPINGKATIVMIDEALLALKKKSGKNILDYFYNDVTNGVRTQNLLTSFVKRLDFTEEKNNSITGIKNYSNAEFGSMAMKGASMDIMAESVSIDSEGDSLLSTGEATVREDFKDIAKYFGTVEVVNGKAEIVVDALPDNLTTWIVDGFVMTKDTHIGLINNSFTVSKDLNILTSLPRFFVINDEFEINAVIINNSDEKLIIIPELTITNAEILELPETIELDANAQASVTWKVKTLRGDTEIDLEKLTSDIVITATSGNQSDSISIQKPIHPYSTPESSFTSGKTTDVSYEEKIILPESIDPELGNLEITMGTNVVNALFKNIEDIIPKKIWFNSYYALETLEKLLSIKNLYSQSGDLEKFEAINITDEDEIMYSAEEVIEKIISGFTGYMSYDGGIQYSKTCRRSPCSNFNLSMKTLDILNKLDEKYYSEELQTFKQKLLVYIKQQLESKINSRNTGVNMYIQATDFIILAQAGKKDFVTKNISSLSKVDTTIARLDRIKLYRILNIESEKKAEIIKKLKNSILIEARGSYLPSGKYTNDESTSKMLTELLLSGENERLTVDNMAQYLSSIHTNANNLFGKSYIIDSLALYLEKYGNLKNISFVGASYLDKKELSSMTFNASNKFDTHYKSVPFKNNFELGKEYSLGFTNLGAGNLHYSANLNYYLPIQEIEPRDEGIIISRKYYKIEDYKKAYKKECYSWGKHSRSSSNCIYKKTQEIENIVSGVSGDMIVGEIEVTVPVDRTNVVVEDFIPAGAEILNTNLDITPEVVKRITGGNNGYYGFNHIENRDEKIFMFAEKLYPGTYKYTYVLKLSHNGMYHNKPAVGYVLDKKEIWGRTRGGFFEIMDK